MNIKRLSSSLLFRIIVAIILGIVCSFFFPDGVARIFVTFNGLFGNFLGFFIPVLIFSLITPAIAGLGRGAGKWLAITTGIAYCSALVSGLISWGVANSVYPKLLAGQHNVQASDIEEGALSPYISVEMPAPMPVMTALILAFVVGVAMTSVKSDTLYSGVADLRRVVMKVISSFIVPLLPIYIFGMFLSLGMNGNLANVLTAFAKVLVLAIFMSFVLLVLQFFFAGAIAGKNPLSSLKNMMPAYFTALGTSSSAATIPVTYESSLKNGVSKSVAGFVIPLCATIHLSGSMMKITLFAFAIMFMNGMDIPLATALGFILMLGVTMVAAPGVPGGAIMAAVGLLSSSLGFNDDQVALMIAAYIAIDSFGTACNVTGDGAIAMVVDKFAKGSISRHDLDDADDLGLAAAIAGIDSKEPVQELADDAAGNSVSATGVESARKS
ncbi:dicarboxylate/amino acid:cation symporter [Corynebacterium pseudotuberculosis]|uniref:Cation:dicarboxylase symporter family transporter n=1 Tax=Corynebacterium pseudotuberculosis (strain C231) TaxID=681645 RepID=D9QDD6_CORP2|nr:dicarboxylate/amino acid:cation symporter [Corynebacterium pseudotuberculosis]ADK29872.1 cation:dicarboxylase symporter family transporter [Corynebacterium pseudotuberculosis FRC41]ADL11521.1 cation:dicarboxylase symporter family transporter [Corynebacterium pseudotuberculosis C231]ADL21934.1 dicarboxylate/amino acid:cation symporter [Corynebacterium pseudotuberculosis 1002]ADO27331.1 cation:dicarboxylase symporter family transporter [Corynebacterium pseudotuberculosis I19]AEK93392.1 Na+/H+